MFDAGLFTWANRVIDPGTGVETYMSPVLKAPLPRTPKGVVSIRLIDVDPKKMKMSVLYNVDGGTCAVDYKLSYVLEEECSQRSVVTGTPVVSPTASLPSSKS